MLGEAFARRRQRIRSVERSAIDRVVDRVFRIESRGLVRLEDLGLRGHNQLWYDPCDWIGTWRALRWLRPTADDVFLDYGAGKGRALIAATMLPFSRIVGVELSEDLVKSARRNIGKARPRQAHRVELVTADARQFDVPDDVSVVHMFCPFTGDVFASTIDRLLASIDRRPRRVRLLYNFPFEHNYLLSTGRFRPVRVQPNSWPAQHDRPTQVIITYEIVDGASVPLAETVDVGAWAGPYDPGLAIDGDFEHVSGDRAASHGTERSNRDGEQPGHHERHRTKRGDPFVREDNAGDGRTRGSAE